MFDNMSSNPGQRLSRKDTALRNYRKFPELLGTFEMTVKFTIVGPHKLNFFIKACHLLALILVKSFASNIKDNFWITTIYWLIVECALSYLCNTLPIRWGISSVFRCT